MFTDLPILQILLAKRQMKALFDYLKPHFVATIQEIINSIRKTNKGPKIKIDFYTLLDAIFELLDSSPKYNFVDQIIDLYCYIEACPYLYFLKYGQSELLPNV